MAASTSSSALQEVTEPTELELAAVRLFHRSLPAAVPQQPAVVAVALVVESLQLAVTVVVAQPVAVLAAFQYPKYLELLLLGQLLDQYCAAVQRLPDSSR